MFPQFRETTVFCNEFPFHAPQPTKCLSRSTWENHRAYLICDLLRSQVFFVCLFCPKSKGSCFIYFVHSCNWLYQKVYSRPSYSVMARSRSSLNSTLLFSEVQIIMVRKKICRTINKLTHPTTIGLEFCFLNI